MELPVVLDSRSLLTWLLSLQKMGKVSLSECDTAKPGVEYSSTSPANGTLYFFSIEFTGLSATR